MRPFSPKYAIMNNVNIVVSVVFSPNGCWEAYLLDNEKNRNDSIESLMRKHPDWDWDYWMAQVA